MNLTQLSTNAIRSGGDLYTNTRTGLSFKGLSNGSGSNMIRVPLNTDLQLSDQISNRSGSYFVTDLQRDTAAVYASVFPVTHSLTNAATGETVPAHLGAAPAPSLDRSVSGHTQPQELTFWIPQRYNLAIGQSYCTSSGQVLTVAAIQRTNNSGYAVLMHA